MNEFEMTREDLKRIWFSWLKVDSTHPKHIRPEQLMEFIQERLYSIVMPYFLYFFSLIDKDFTDKCDFEEFLPALVIFLLLDKRQMTAFVFKMLDEDRDDNLSKTDLFRFFMQYRDGQRLFPLNMIRALEICQVNRGDRIDIIEFAEVAQKVPYITFPCVRLQGIMREKFGGT